MLRSTFSSLREYLTPVTNTSSFQKTGQITPAEFVQAGDYLVYKFPTWSWSAASPGKERDFLPKDKQFLVTKHVPCRERASTATDTLTIADDGADGDDDAWVVSEDSSRPVGKAAPAAVDVADLDGDLESELEGLGIEESGPGVDAPAESGHAHGSSSSSGIEERTYNVYITYSTSYRVPKAYLSGHNADGAPLPPRAMFDDIVSDYKDKTVTIEPAPFQDKLTLISIHPCRHAGVMRMLLDRAEASAASASVDDEWEEVPTGLRVDQYLVIFLKFIASVTPTIEYDFTMSAL